MSSQRYWLDDAHARPNVPKAQFGEQAATEAIELFLKTAPDETSLDELAAAITMIPEISHLVMKTLHQQDLGELAGFREVRSIRHAIALIGIERTMMILRDLHQENATTSEAMTATHGLRRTA